MTSDNLPLVAAVSVGVLTFVILFKPFFGKKKDFWECVVYYLKPNFFSWLDKDLERDYAKSMKLGLFLLLCFGAGFITHSGVEMLMESSCASRSTKIHHPLPHSYPAP